MRMNIKPLIHLFLLSIFILLSACSDTSVVNYQAITIENVSDLVEIATWTESEGDFIAASFSPNSSELALFFKNNELQIFSLQTMETVTTISDFDIDAEYLTYSANGTEILLSNRRGDYVLIDLEKSEVLSTQEVENPELWYLPTGDTRRIEASNFDDSITIYNTLTGQELRAFDDVQSAALSKDASLVLIRNKSLVTQVWDIASGELTLEVMPPSGDVANNPLYGSGFTDDGLVWTTYPQRIETDGRTIYNSSIQFWNIETGEVVMEIEGTNAFYSSLQTDPTGRYLLSWGLNPQSYSSRCWIWEISSLQELPCPAGGNAWATFSPDGEMLVVNNGTDYNVRFYEIALTPNLASTLDTQPTYFVEFSADDQFMLTIDTDIHLWAIPTD